MENPLSTNDKEDSEWNINSNSGNLPGDYIFTCNGIEICNFY